jgi:hypothetical protein
MAIHELHWRCGYCSQEQLGRNKVCQNCGKPRGEGVKFFKPGLEDHAVSEGPARTDSVTDPELLKLANAGADWYCRFCGAGNIGTGTICAQCGGEQKEPPPTETPDEPEPTPSAQRLPEPEPEPPASFALPTIPTNIWQWGAAVALIIALLGGCVFLLTPHDTPVTVTGFEWSRTIQIEVYKTVRESDWSIPAGGRQVSTEQKVKSYDHVIDHYTDEHYTVSVYDHTRHWTTNDREQVGTEVCGETDLGNGFSQDKYCPVYGYVEHDHSEDIYRQEDRVRRVPVYKDVPVYATWYTYDIEKWVSDYVASAGAKDQNPSWPPVALQTNQRTAGRSEGYTVFLAGKDGKHYWMGLPQAKWAQLKTGQRLTASINALGMVTGIKELQGVAVQQGATQ